MHELAGRATLSVDHAVGPQHTGQAFANSREQSLAANDRWRSCVSSRSSGGSSHASSSWCSRARLVRPADRRAGSGRGSEQRCPCSSLVSQRAAVPHAPSEWQQRPYGPAFQPAAHRPPCAPPPRTREVLQGFILGEQHALADQAAPHVQAAQARQLRQRLRQPVPDAAELHADDAGRQPALAVGVGQHWHCGQAIHGEQDSATPPGTCMPGWFAAPAAPGCVGQRDRLPRLEHKRGELLQRPQVLGQAEAALLATPAGKEWRRQRAAGLGNGSAAAQPKACAQASTSPLPLSAHRCRLCREAKLLSQPGQQPRLVVRLRDCSAGAAARATAETAFRAAG